MKTIKRLSIFFLALLLVSSFAVAAFAADSSFTYVGHNLFGFGPGSEFSDTDLFDEFKGVMPGDSLTETVTVKNEADCCDFIKIYLRAAVHDSENPLSPNVAERESVASMQDFLSQLTMTVWNAEQEIFEGAPNEQAGTQNNVFLGTFRHNEGTTLTVQLNVPAELGNAYANRIGEVDWVFVVEEYDDADPSTPQTGDHTPVLLYAILMAGSALGLLLLFLSRKKKKMEE